MLSMSKPCKQTTSVELMRCRRRTVGGGSVGNLHQHSTTTITDLWRRPSSPDHVAGLHSSKRRRWRVLWLVGRQDVGPCCWCSLPRPRITHHQSTTGRDRLTGRLPLPSLRSPGTFTFTSLLSLIWNDFSFTPRIEPKIADFCSVLSFAKKFSSVFFLLSLDTHAC